MAKKTDSTGGAFVAEYPALLSFSLFYCAFLKYVPASFDKGTYSLRASY